MSDYTPEQWRQIFANAKAALLKDRTNARALAAFRAALPTISAEQDATRKAEYLKDIDPGWLASAGLGAADMMSFGLGDQVARKLLGETATMTQEQAKGQHPTAHLLGEAAGLIGPAGIEVGLAKAGRLVPTALTTLVRGIQNRVGRAAAKTAVNAVTGAAYAGAQAAGRTEGSLGERARAAGRAAPYGAAAGAVLPVAIGAVPTAVNRLVTRPAKAIGRAGGEVVDRIAGKAIPRRVPLDFDLLPPGQRAPTAPKTRDPLDIPTFSRRPPPALGIPNGGLLAPARASEGLLGPIPRAGKPGHPVWRGEGSPTRSPDVRGGEPLTPSKHTLPQPSAEAARILRKQSFAKLSAAYRNPETPDAVKQLILAEFQRRGIVVSP